MATIRPIDFADTDYDAPPEWWTGLPDKFTLSVDDIEHIILEMGWEDVDVQAFLEIALKLGS